MIPEPVILIVLAIIVAWVYFGAGHAESGKGGGATDPEAARLKAQAIKEAAIQSVIDAELRGEIDVKTRNSQIAHLSRLPTNPQDGPGGSR
jgi:hypothetical protein